MRQIGTSCREYERLLLLSPYMETLSIAGMAKGIFQRAPGVCATRAHFTPPFSAIF